MAGEAELEGRLLTEEAWRMLVKRYEFIGRFADGKRLLDVGCGGGLGFNYLLEAGVAHITGVDISEENLRHASRVSSGVILRRADAQALPFDDESFDVVSVMQVIQYLDINQFLSEAWRVLGPSGRIIISLPNIQRMDGFKKSRMSREYLTGAELVEQLCNAGFKTEMFGLFPLGRDCLNPRKQFVHTVHRIVVNIILAIPGGERVKDFLVGIFLPRIRGHVVSREDVDNYFEPEYKLDGVSEITNYQILYIVGRKN
jgi:SAM-dependent methyltransferase